MAKTNKPNNDDGDDLQDICEFGSQNELEPMDSYKEEEEMSDSNANILLDVDKCLIRNDANSNNEVDLVNNRLNSFEDIIEYYKISCLKKQLNIASEDCEFQVNKNTIVMAEKRLNQIIEQLARLRQRFIDCEGVSSAEVSQLFKNKKETLFFTTVTFGEFFKTTQMYREYLTWWRLLIKNTTQQLINYAPQASVGEGGEEPSKSETSIIGV